MQEGCEEQEEGGTGGAGQTRALPQEDGDLHRSTVLSATGVGSIIIINL